MGVRARSGAVSAAAMVGTMAVGLVFRYAPLGLPAFWVKYGGSAMWALMIYWVISTALRRVGPVPLVLLAGTIATAVEFFKLYRSPGMDAFRGTLPGILLLGRYFSWRDIVAYWVAICIGAWVDSALRTREWQRI